MMPWKLLADSDRYINSWLLGYSGGLGSIAGVLICRLLVRPQEGSSCSPTSTGGRVRTRTALGTNWAAIVATAAGCAVAWIGLFVPRLHVLYDAAWFTGTGTSALLYLLAMRGAQKTSKG